MESRFPARPLREPASTVIVGPPERIPARSPARNGALVRLGIADGAKPEKAGTGKGMLSAIMSANAASIDIRFVQVDIVEVDLSEVGHATAWNRHLLNCISEMA
jgi:hypothetical protein